MFYNYIIKPISILLFSICALFSLSILAILLASNYGQIIQEIKNIDSSIFVLDVSKYLTYLINLILFFAGICLLYFGFLAIRYMHISLFSKWFSQKEKEYEELESRIKELNEKYRKMKREAERFKGDTDEIREIIAEIQYSKKEIENSINIIKKTIEKSFYFLTKQMDLMTRFIIEQITDNTTECFAIIFAFLSLYVPQVINLAPISQIVSPLIPALGFFFSLQVKSPNCNTRRIYILLSCLSITLLFIIWASFNWSPPPSKTGEHFGRVTYIVLYSLSIGCLMVKIVLNARGDGESTTQWLQGFSQRIRKPLNFD